MFQAVRRLLSAGIAYVRRQARFTAHSAVKTARQDPFLQQVIGEITANAFAIDQAVAAATAALDRTVAAFARRNEAQVEQAPVSSALATAQTQLLLGQLRPRSAERMFVLSGVSATSRDNNFDRH